jgi:hypothetical protein
MSNLKIINLGDKKSRTLSKKNLYKEILSSSKKVTDIIKSKRFDYLNNVVRNKKVVHFEDDGNEKKQISESDKDKIKQNLQAVKQKLGLDQQSKNNEHNEYEKMQQEIKEQIKKHKLEAEQREKELELLMLQKRKREEHRREELERQYKQQKELELKKVQEKLETESRLKQKQLDSLKKRKFIENLHNRTKKLPKKYKQTSQQLQNKNVKEVQHKSNSFNKNVNTFNKNINTFNNSNNSNNQQLVKKTPLLKYFNQTSEKDAMILKKSKSLKKKNKILEIVKLLKENRYNIKRINIILNKLDRSYIIDLLLAFNLIKRRSNAPKKLLDTILLNYITSDIIVSYRK